VRIRFYRQFWEIGRVSIHWWWTTPIWGIERGINNWVTKVWPAVIFIPAREIQWNSLILDHILFWVGRWRLRIQVDPFKWMIGVYFGDDDSGILIGPLGLSWECYDLEESGEEPTGPQRPQ
jgi:hypothetical protein